MKLTIGETTYTALTNLKFDPAADVAGDEVPINEFSVDVKTEDDIDAMQYAWLRDDTNRLWAKYWIVYADRMDNKTVTVKAQSSLKLLERRMLDAAMLDEEPVENILEDIFDELGAASYILDESLEGATFTNYVPYQSAKTRLQWVCFVLGAYIKSFFSEMIEIRPIGTTPKLIPVWNLKWKPSLTYSEYRTRISVTAYSYVEQEPGTTDTWVEAGGKIYIQTQLNHGLRNPDVPAGALTHESHFTGITLVNSGNVDEILTRLGPLYFKRVTAELDAINNGDYLPGDLVYFYTDEREMGLGYIERADFSFGTQTVARMKITPVDTVDTGALTIICKYGDTELGRIEYVFPLNYPYEIDLPSLDQMWGQTRYVFVPETAQITGTVEEDGTEVEADYVIALGEYMGTVLISSVDAYTVDEGTVVIS